MKVKDIMNPDVLCAEIPGSREQVVEIMKQRKVSGMPVVKKGTRTLIGMISRRDILSDTDEEQLALLMTTDVATLTPDAPIEECIRLMVSRGFRRIPVTDGAGKELAGIVTVGDIVHKVVAKSDSKVKVKDLMRRTVVCCWSNTPVPLLKKILQMSGECALLALDDEEKIVGLLSETDLINLMESKIEEKASLLKSGSSQEWDWETSSVLYITKAKAALPPVPLHQVMVSQYATISESASIIECAQKMQKLDINQMPVTDAKGEIVGMICDEDLLKSL